MEPSSRSRGATWLLTAGAGAGIAMAACGLLASRTDAARRVPKSAVARVNGQAIAVADYRRVLAGLANDRRDGIEEADRRRVLDRLIDEELLIQRGLDLGLAHSDRRVRSDLTAAVVAAAIGVGGSSVPSDDELESFYDAHREQFVTPERIRLRQIFFRIPGDSAKAPPEDRARDGVLRARAGEPFDNLASELGDEEIAPLPDALLPPAKLVDYLGPTALRAALGLVEGEVSEPVRSGQGLHVLLVVAREAGAPRPLDDVRSEVAAEILRRRDEAALRSYLDRLRADAAIDVRDDAL